LLVNVDSGLAEWSSDAANLYSLIVAYLASDEMFFITQTGAKAHTVTTP
jgi:hypothetical protein